ncbi:MAG: 5'-nucleotidase C-terminal domain-containing protein [Prevotella sp.]|nr:5'-nucleotidase C-terminal domain-containing protein [Prevotella sp.]
MKKTVAVCLVALCMSIPTMAKQKTIRIKVIETSDVHGSFFPYDFITRNPKAGTMARVSSYVNAMREEYGENLILLDNGDILQGQPTCYYSNFIDTESPNIAAEVTNYLKYDAQTIGNHDVEPGHAVYDKCIKDVKCPMLGANIIDTKTGKPYLQPYIIFNRQGVKIAVIGLLTPAIPNWLSNSLWSGLRFEEMVTSAKHWMSVVQETEHPDIVIGLFHSGKEGGIITPEYDEDASIKVAKEVPGFDIVLYGHDHTRHHDIITNIAGQEVVCLDPANNANSVADVSINLTMKRKKVVEKVITGGLINMNDQPVDEAYMQHFQQRIDEVNNFVNRKIGEFKSSIYTRDCYFGSSAFNDLILNLELQITKADIAFNAPLSFNASIKEGPIYMSDMFSLYRYENQLYVMRLTGEEIRKHLEMSYDLWVNTMQSPDDHLLLLDEQTTGDQQRLGFKNFSFNFDSAAGIDYEVDVTKPDGQKVHILQMSNGQPFDEKKWYNVAVNSYRGNGGGELLTHGAGIPRDSLESRIIWRSEKDQRYYLMKEIEKQQVMDPQPNNNWRFIPEEWVKPAAERDRKLLFKQ